MTEKNPRYEEANKKRFPSIRNILNRVLKKKEGEKTETSKFNEDHDQIIKKYYDKELFIHPEELAISIIVPTSSELMNGNFSRMILSIKDFDEKLSDRYELLFVVNNLEPDKNQEVFLENQLQLALLKFYQLSLVEIRENEGEIEKIVNDLGNHLRSLGVNETTINALQICLRKKIQLYGIDASSQGKNVDKASEYDYPPGKAKNIGGHIALERKSPTIESKRIDFKDADVTFPPEYIENLLKRDEESISFGIDVSFSLFPEIDESVMTTINEQITTVEFYISEVLLGNKGIYSYIHINYDLGSVNLRPETYREGPQLAITDDIFERISGYPTGGHRGEDFVAVGRTMSVATDKGFYYGDLPTIEASVGKYDSADLLNWKNLSPNKDIQERIKRSMEFFLKKTAKVYSHYQENPKFIKHLKEQHQLEIRRRKRKISSLSEAIKVVISKNQIEPADSKNKFDELVKSNPSLVRIIEHFFDNGSRNADEVMALFQSSLPVLFADPEENTSYEKLLDLANENEEDNTPITLNQRDFIHIARSAYLTEVELREIDRKEEELTRT